MSNIVRFDAIRSLGFASITASYIELGGPFDHAMRVLHFINGTDADIMISFDRVNDNIVLLADTFALYDLTSDQDSNEHFRYQEGSQLLIKYLQAPTRGTFYAIAVYGKGE